MTLFVAASSLLAVADTWTDKPSQTIKPVETKTDAELEEDGYVVVHDVEELIAAYGRGGRKNIALGADIDLGGMEWSPLGTIEERAYTGCFDGNGYKIVNLKIDGGEKKNIGFFGYTSGAILCNVVFENVEIIGGENVGVLVGNAYNTTIDNCVVKSGSVRAGSVAGGLVGYSNSSHITASYAELDKVEATTSTAGGLVGTSYEASISQSYAESNVKTGSYAGGLVGSNTRSFIDNSYAAGTVEGTVAVGGFVGQSTGVKIENCYTTAKVKGTNDVGGFLGILYGKSNNTVENSFFDVAATTQTEGIGNHSTAADSQYATLYGRTTEEMKDAQTFAGAGWDETMWHFYPNSYPCLLARDEVEPVSGKPTIEGDEDATVTGDAENGFVVRPSDGKTTVEVSIPQGVEPTKVTVEVSPKVARVTTHGAAVMVMGIDGNCERCDITALLDIPGARICDGGGVVATQEDGVIDLTQATVKEEIVKEAIDQEKGAIVKLNATNPTITTSTTRRGLLYTFREGETLDGLVADEPQTQKGNGEPWTPTITVKGGDSGFYAIGVSKGE